jgi:hypothetical protein
MRWLFFLIAMASVTWMLGWAFMRANPAQLASGLRVAGPVAVGIVGGALVLLGRAQVGGVLLAIAAAWWTAAKRSGAVQSRPGRKSTVRTAVLEMELDHDTGALEGMVLAGRHEGRVLGEMDLPSLIALRGEILADGESLQLLETYLQGRFPAWRDDVDPDIGEGKAGAPASGAMTEKEAYQILGLEPGAGAADIRKAHRRLMQRLHPDLGGSSFLAARINEAKDFLLSMHG